MCGGDLGRWRLDLPNFDWFHPVKILTSLRPCHAYHTPFGFLHHSTTTWVTTWGLHPGPPPTFWVMVLAQSTTFWQLRFSAAGGARPAFRSPNWWFVYWSSGFLWLHFPAFHPPFVDWRARTSNPHVSYGVGHKYLQMARAEGAPRPGVQPHQKLRKLPLENSQFAVCSSSSCAAGVPATARTGISSLQLHYLYFTFSLSST